ncbi:MAG: response regulator [Hyphomicrobiaceae bacterium]
MRKSDQLNMVIADDDADDRLLIEDAFQECCLSTQRDYVGDGAELLEYLRAEEKWSHRDASALPSIILLDLNMPRMDGRTALAHIKADPVLKRIPVVVLTTSKADEDIARTYDLGVNSFITKPVTFAGLVDAVQALNDFWLENVQLPSQFEAA